MPSLIINELGSLQILILSIPIFNGTLMNIVNKTMKKIMHWVLVATLICGVTVFTACTNDDNPAVVTEVSITPSQSRVGYSSWKTQVSYTHCDPLPKTGKPELVSGTWEMNDGILQHKACD